MEIEKAKPAYSGCYTPIRKLSRMAAQRVRLFRLFDELLTAPYSVWSKQAKTRLLRSVNVWKELRKEVATIICESSHSLSASQVDKLSDLVVPAYWVEVVIPKYHAAIRQDLQGDPTESPDWATIKKIEREAKTLQNATSRQGILWAIERAYSEAPLPRRAYTEIIKCIDHRQRPRITGLKVVRHPQVIAFRYAAVAYLARCGVLKSPATALISRIENALEISGVHVTFDDKPRSDGVRKSLSRLGLFH